MNALGELRPSQFIFTFGVGALLDLPQLSVMVLGLQNWDVRYSHEIHEDRLLVALQRRLGHQVSRLLLPPIPPDDQQRNPGAPPIGVPVVPFPRWLRCPACQSMATIESGLFQLIQDQYHPDRTRYVHQTCPKARVPPTALPVRFLLACREGHLTDFPWIEFVHAGKAICKPARLTMFEFGPSGDVLDIMIKCHSCNASRSMSEAFDREHPFSCSGHHPHLRQIKADKCPEDAKPILLGASNSWFPQVMSALSIPEAGDDTLAQLVETHWATLKNVTSLEVARFAIGTIPALMGYPAEQIWPAIEAYRQRAAAVAPDDDVADLKAPEWAVFTDPDHAPQGSDFKLTRVAPPQGFTAFEDMVRIERLREVRALFGFNRLESNGDFTDATFSSEGRYTPLSPKPPTWLPATEVRGEGLFLRLKEDEVIQWEARPAVQALEAEFRLAHRHWRKLRHIDPPDADFPGIRYVLIHSLAHALMRQIALDCGYTAASLRERLYCRRPGDLHGPMAGFLLYTAASDSEGTLGGLVELGYPLTLGRHLHQALENLRICTSDPLCAEHTPSRDGRGIHAASCHACLFSPETSCERGNRYVDRSVLLPTLSRVDTAFFTL